MNPTDHPFFEQSWPEGEYRFFQVGFLVDDVIAAATNWAATHGIGPFHVIPVVEQSLISRGEPANISIQVAIAQAGPVQIELIQQHCERPSIFTEWSQGRTCAFHQLATVTSDFEGKKAHYEQLGYQLVAESPSGGGIRVAYFDTVADFGFYVEVVEHSPRLVAHWEEVSQTCATWDGTDPVRLLTRDGYRVP